MPLTGARHWSEQSSPPRCTRLQRVTERTRLRGRRCTRDGALGGGGGDQLNELGWVLEITFTIASPSPQAGPDRGGWDGVASGGHVPASIWSRDSSALLSLPRSS